VIALYLFGGEVLEGFAFTMMVGIISGTYSTVFIAAAIAIMLQGRKPIKGQVVAPSTAVRKPGRRRAS
jgi:preprotein translocase subunit SecF